MPPGISPRPANGASIDDVARLAGVSSQTVSRVTANSPHVRPATRDRVMRAMQQLGYAPNRAARALRSGSSHTLGLLTRRLNRTGEASIAAAVVAAADVRGYAVTLVQMSTEPQGAGLAQAAARLSDSAIDGLIVVETDDQPGAALTIPTHVPVAVCDPSLADRYPAVLCDQAAGARAAVEHLLALGHRTVHHITGAPTSRAAAIRAATWRATLAEAGAPVPEPWVGDWTAHRGAVIGQQIAANRDVTAVFCANDETAFGLISALHNAGVRVPQDVSVVGFDGLELSAFASPALTTVYQDFEQLGTRVVDLLLDHIHSVPAAGIPARVTVPTQLLVRASTCPPGSRGPVA